MARCSNIVLGIMNFLGLILGIGMLIWVFSIRNHWATECVKLVMRHLLASAIVFIVISLIGLIGSCCKSNCCLWIYMFILILWFVGLLVSASFMFYIANSSSQTKDFVQKTWAQEMVGKNWPSVKNCLLQGQFCQAMAKNSTATSLEEFKMEKRNIVENVCCMPPEDCGFVFKNATYWEVPVTGLVKNDGDCKVWNNQIDGKCYDCDKCKEMFVGDLRKDALYIGIALICETVFVLITFCIGCCARKNNKQTKYNP